MGELLAAAALVLYSINIVLTKLASARVDIGLGFLLSVAVNVIFSALMLCLQLGVRTEPFVWNWHGFYVFLIAGVFSTYLGRWFFFESVVRFGPARASIFQISAPLFTVVIAWMFLGEQLSAAALGGILLTVFGLLVVVYVPGVLSVASAPKQGAALAVGPPSPFQWIFSSSLILGMFAAMSYGLGNVLRGLAVRNWDEPIAGGLLGALSGLVLHVLLGSGSTKLWSKLKNADQKGMLLFMLTGVMNISAQILSISSLSYIAVSIMTLIVCCVPVLVIPMSYVFLKNQEGITFRTLIGATLTLGGITTILVA